jgi:hypothetical protein
MRHWTRKARGAHPELGRMLGGRRAPVEEAILREERAGRGPGRPPTRVALAAEAAGAAAATAAATAVAALVSLLGEKRLLRLGKEPLAALREGLSVCSCRAHKTARRKNIGVRHAWPARRGRAPTPPVRKDSVQLQRTV